jgi:hypothetical protein
MKKLPAFAILIALTPALLGQTLPAPYPRIEGRYMLSTVTRYCQSVESFSSQYQPRLFAAVDGPSAESPRWAEYSGEPEWKAAREPKPLALVWYRDDHVARVLIASEDGNNGRRVAEYCYRPDGTLARIRSIPEVWKQCDPSHLRCSFTFAKEGLYLPNGRAVKGPSDAIQSSLVGLADSDTTPANSGVSDLRPLKSEETSFSFAEFPVEYLKVQDLPFSHLLFTPEK